MHTIVTESRYLGEKYRDRLTGQRSIEWPSGSPKLTPG